MRPIPRLLLLNLGRPEVPYRFAVAARTDTAVARYRPYIPNPKSTPFIAGRRHGADRVDQTYRIIHPAGAWK